MSIVRKYKLYKLGIPQKKNDVELFEFLESEISEFEYFTHKKLPNSKFFMKKIGIFRLEYFEKNKNLYVVYSDFWDVLKTTHHLTSEEIKLIMKEVASKILGLDIYDVSGSAKRRKPEVEKYYRRKFNIQTN